MPKPWTRGKRTRDVKDEFEKIKKGINEGRLKNKDITKIDRRIGRWQGRYTKAAAMIDVELIKDGKRLVDLNIQRKTEKLE